MGLAPLPSRRVPPHRYAENRWLKVDWPNNKRAQPWLQGAPLCPGSYTPLCCRMVWRSGRTSLPPPPPHRRALPCKEKFSMNYSSVRLCSTYSNNRCKFFKKTCRLRSKCTYWIITFILPILPPFRILLRPCDFRLIQLTRSWQVSKLLATQRRWVDAKIEDGNQTSKHLVRVRTQIST